MKEDIKVKIIPLTIPIEIAEAQLDLVLLNGIDIFLLKNSVSNRNIVIDKIRRNNNPVDSCGLKLMKAQPKKMRDKIYNVLSLSV